MDTNLKISKKIRLFLYRIILVGSFFTMIGTLVMGREALYAWYTEGRGILTGELYYLPEFREYISKLYTYGMIAYGGAGDDNGYPLDVTDNSIASNQAYISFKETLSKGEEDLLYHVKRGKNVVIKSDYKSPLYSPHDGHLLLPEEVILCCYWDGSNKKLQFFEGDAYQSELLPEYYFSYQYKPNSEKISSLNFIIALKDVPSYSSKYLQKLDQLARTHRAVLFTLIISASLVLLLGLIRLITSRGTHQVMRSFSTLTGNIFFEIKIVLLIILFLWSNSYCLWSFTASQRLRYQVIPHVWLYGLIGIILYLLYKDIRYNGKQVFQHSILYTLVVSMVEHFRNLGWKRKVSLLYISYFVTGIVCFVAGLGLLCQNTVMGLRILALLLLVAGLMILILQKRFYRLTRDIFSISDRLEAINNGNSEMELQLSKASLLTQMSNHVTDVELGIEAAVENTLRANKMRVELITNVSHDLKTPLTSIINYADLLCEENLPAPANEYALSLRQKAYRLKGMVQDVFELSKATSGNLPMEKIRLDLTKLMHQTLADMDEQIQESTLTFKTNICNTPLMIEADGEKLYRIFQNLIVNALQYSLENSRVYIEVAKQEENACVWIKSISRQELDFDPKEIVERFVRADASRTTEGSGLGLSIVQSFTEACGGTFSIDLNADLFTAFVSFPLSLEPLEEEQNEEDT